MTIQKEIEMARKKMTDAIEYAYAGQNSAADRLFQECRDHLLRAERGCDDVERKAKQAIEMVKT